MPTCAEDRFTIGEKRNYPDESGPVYRALENTSYSPDAYPDHWKKVKE